MNLPKVVSHQVVRSQVSKGFRNQLKAGELSWTFRWVDPPLIWMSWRMVRTTDFCRTLNMTSRATREVLINSSEHHVPPRLSFSGGRKISRIQLISNRVWAHLNVQLRCKSLSEWAILNRFSSRTFGRAHRQAVLCLMPYWKGLGRSNAHQEV